MQTQEIWKDIIGFEGLYQISNHGRIKSLERTVMRKDGFATTVKESIKFPSIMNTGYYMITLYKNNIAKYCTMHRLLAIHFIPNPENKPYINHIDGSRDNNSLKNLEWCTQSENMQHAMRSGVMKEQFKSGFAHQLCKLTPEDVRGIKKLRAEGKTLKIIGELYNISGRHASGIARGETHNNITI